MRTAGFIPAVLYGAGKNNLLLSINAKEINKLFENKTESPFIQLSIASEKQPDKRLVIIKEWQRHPLSRSPWHIDFLELNKKEETTFEIAVHFVGTPSGVEKGGEVLPIKSKVLVSCLPDDLVAGVEVDISALDIGDTLKVGDIVFGKKIKVLDNLGTPLLSVHAHRETAVASAEQPIEAHGEPEVIKQKSEHKE